MDGVSESFDDVVCDGSHCGLEGQVRGLTKAEEDLASSRIVHLSVCLMRSGSEESEVRRERPAFGGESF